jgi:acyl carrier protein
VQQLLVERLHLGCAPDEIDPDCPLMAGGLELDSMDALEVVVGLEQVFGVAISDDAASRRALRSVGAIADLVMSAPAGGAAGGR